MNQRHHIESLIIVAVAAYAAKHFSRKHSNGSRRGKRTKQRARRTVEEIHQCLGDATSVVRIGCLGFPFGHCMISCVAQLKRPLRKLPKSARRPEGEKKEEGCR